jgi:hypothetical protein
MTLRTLALIASLALAACGGGDNGVRPDGHAGDDDDGGPDALDPCGWHEQDDVANDATAETTGLTVSSAGAILCGQIDARAPGNDELVDADLYQITVPADGHYLVRIASANAGDLDLVEARFHNSDGHSGRYVGTHGVFVSSLAAGTQTLEIDAHDASAPSAAIPYRLIVTPDDVDVRCARLTGNPSYGESHDGQTHDGNDVVTMTFDQSFTTGQTVLATDAPEPTNLVIAPAMSYLLEGATDVNGGYSDSYADRDTYKIATGANSNELSIRVDWADDPGTTDDVDLDAYLFAVPAGASDAPKVITLSGIPGVAGPELATTAVLPSTEYWLTIGARTPAFNASKAYAITVCGATFTP